MPKTRNFSDPEKPNAMHLLTCIHHRTLRRRQNATLSEKSFSLSAKRTMSDKLITKKQLPDNSALTPEKTAINPMNPSVPTVSVYATRRNARNRFSATSKYRDHLFTLSSQNDDTLSPMDQLSQALNLGAQRMPSAYFLSPPD